MQKLSVCEGEQSTTRCRKHKHPNRSRTVRAEAGFSKPAPTHAASFAAQTESYCPRTCARPTAVDRLRQAEQEGSQTKQRDSAFATAAIDRRRKRFFRACAQWNTKEERREENEDTREEGDMQTIRREQAMRPRIEQIRSACKNDSRQGVSTNSEREIHVHIARECKLKELRAETPSRGQATDS